MAEASVYTFNATLQADHVDGDGNVCHHWWSAGDNQWVTDVLTGPSGVTEVKERAVQGCGVSWILNAFGHPARIDLFAVAESGGKIHAYYTPEHGWHSDLLPGAGTAMAVTAGGPVDEHDHDRAGRPPDRSP